MTQITFLIALVGTISGTDSGIATNVPQCTGSTETFIVNYVEQNCTSSPEYYPGAVSVPSGRTFTGNCVNGKCESTLADMHVINGTVTIPPWKIMLSYGVRVRYTANTTPDCSESQPCTQMSVPVCDITWLAPWTSNCENEPPDDPGGG
jgi:hypothetical protein